MKASGTWACGRWALALLLVLSGARFASSQVTITEILYNPGPAGAEGNQQEFFEIFNTTPEAVDLSGWYVSRGVSWEFPNGTWLAGGAYLAVCADANYIKSRYGITNAVGPWTADTSLSNGGETIAICEPSGVEIATVRYNDRGKWPGAADGTGHSLEIEYPYAELDDPDSWAHSRDLGGSPGKVNPSSIARNVVINEGLIWTSGARWVELHNVTGAAVSLANYYITDDPRDLTKVRLGSVSIPARGWLALTDAELGLDFTPVGALPGGRTFVALVSSTGTRVVDAYNFEPSVAGRSEARFPDGDEDWSPAATPTQGSANAVEVETDVVIHEIMYHPIDDSHDREFVELYNRGTSAVSLDGCQLSQGIDFRFPPGTTIPADGYLVVARNPAKIRTLYGLPAGSVLGPEDPDALDDFGFLANGGERVTLVDANGNVMDTVRYYDGGEWPRWPDGLGSSLELVDPFADNSRSTAWDSSDDSAKAVAQTFSYSGRHVGGGESELHFALMNNGIAILDDIAIRAGGVTIVEDQVFVPFGASWRYFKGTAEPSSPTTAWRQLGFADGAWATGNLPIGFGETDIATNLGDMGGAGGYLTVFSRKTFTVANVAAIDKLYVDVRYDDGVYVYLNGTQVAGRNIVSPDFDAAAATAVEPTLEQLDITQHKSLLVNGTNVLAVQLHNASLTSSDALMDAKLYSAHVSTEGGGPNLVANGTFDANDGGWIIEGNHIDSGRTTVDPITGAGSLKLIATGRGDNKVNRIETETSPAMNTTDTYTVSFKARWVVGSRTVITHGYQNLDTNLAKSHQLAIPEDLGTPGAMNSVTERRIAALGSEDMGPTISSVSQSPAVPQANEAVTVTARIGDPEGVAGAKVKYFVNKPGAGQSLEPVPVGIFYDHRDVGGPCAPGDTTSSSATTYAVTGGGDDIWTGGDQFQFAYGHAQGNFTMTARLASKAWAPGSRWGKVGIMARQSLGNMARYAMAQDHGEDLQDLSRFAGRPTDGGADNFEIGLGAAGDHPTWLRLQRTGNVFIGYGSSNGTSWTEMERMDWGAGAPSTVLLGLAVCSHAGCATTTIDFANVAFTGTWTDPTDPGGTPCVDTACEVAMADPDGDGVYTAVIPGLALGNKVLFSIEATDPAGNLQRYPVDVTQRTHPELLDPTDGSPFYQEYLIYRHDTRNIDSTSPTQKYRFIMHDYDEAYLDARQTLSNDFVNGSFVFGTDDLHYFSRIRFAGSPWARTKWGSFRLRTPRQDALHGEIHQCNLEQNQWGPSDGHQRLSHYLLRYLSRPWAPAPYDFPRLVHVWVNARDIGVRSHYEVPNGDTLEKWWPDDDTGDFFEVDDRFELNDAGARINSRDAFLRYPPYGSNGDDQEEYRWYFNLRRDEDGDNYGNLLDFAKIMDPGDTSDAQFDALIDQYANVENFLRIWAVRMNSDDWDTWGTSRGKNAYLYRPPTEGLWHMLPWDMELTYGDVNSFGHPTGSGGSFNFSFPEVNRLLNRPRIRRLYYGILREMVDGPFRSAHLTAYMTRLDALGIGGTDAGKSGGFVDQRRTRIQSWISPVSSPTVQLAITSPNNGNATTVAQPVVDLSGTAPVGVFQIVVANDALQYEEGQVPPVVFSATSMTQWSLSNVPLVPGVNNLTVLGYGSQGNLVDDDTIQVTVTADWDAPTINGLDPASAEPAEVLTITGSDFHTGIKVYFGTTNAAGVVFDESTDPTRVRVPVPSLTPSSYTVRVVNIDGQQSNLVPFTILPPTELFVRGDANVDGVVDISDPVRTLLHLFSGADAPCEDAMDSDDSGTLNVTDAIRTLDYLFMNGPAPSAPFPAKGEDPTTSDLLDCGRGSP